MFLHETKLRKFLLLRPLSFENSKRGLFSRCNFSDNYLQVPRSMHSNMQLLYLLFRVATRTVLENPGKSWNWGKKFSGPGKSLNWGRSPWKSWNGQKISFFISKNNKSMLLVKIFLIRQCYKTKTATSQGRDFCPSELLLVVFHCQDQNNKVYFEKNV